MVILIAELDVDRYDGHLRDSEDENDGDDGQEAEDIIIPGFVLTKRLENEEKLNENNSKGN